MSKTRPEITIVNGETGEILVREMNDDELAQWKVDEEREMKRQADLDAKAKARQAILDRLGLSEDEAKILLG